MRNSLHVDPEVQPVEFVLSRSQGLANQPKDFEWVEKNIPCQAACPAGTDIPGYLDAIVRGRYDEAYLINLRDNVFPAALGRVCTRPCEPACRHGWEGLGDPVAICFSKRSAEAFMQSKEPVTLPAWFESSGHTVGVVGGGAAGLTVARELSLFGHRVTVYEKHTSAGGLMVQGIPAFRLPREVVEREVEQVRLTGVEIRCGVEVGRDVSLQELLGRHDVVVVSPGTLQPVLPALPGIELNGIRHGLEFLFDVHKTGTGEVGRRVVVIGGGFTAVDCARTALRLGAETVGVYYRRSEAEMYITPGELDELRTEGIVFETLAQPVRFEEDAGRVSAVRFSRVDLGPSDDSGRAEPRVRPESEFRVETDTVLLGTGQAQHTYWIDEALRATLADAEGVPRLQGEYGTFVDALYVAGDFATGAISLIDAIGHARQCAREIDRRLMGEERLEEAVRIEPASETGRTREMDRIPRQPMPALLPAFRSLDAEVDTGYDEEMARTEAQRCYLCHYKYEIDNDLCIYCDRCVKVKPVENCIVKVRSIRFADDGKIAELEPSTSNRDYNLLFIDQDKCIRCGACADVCPVDCISLQKVSSTMVRADDLPPSFRRT